LYQDLNNVVDYLTKPFAPSVLTAVVGHLLQKETPAPVAEPAMPQDFMDKVTRLLDLMESKPPAKDAPQNSDDASIANGAASEAPVAATPRAKARRPRKTMVTVPAPDALLRKIRLAVQKHVRARLRQIPELDAGLDRPESEEFLLERLLAKEVLTNIATDLVRATGMPPEAPGALRCPVTLAPLDVLLRHLHTARLTGELRIETNNEIVLVLLQLGEVVFLTTNNPRSYCAAAPCDFQSVPNVAIGEAVRLQEEQSIPFFISLNHAGHLPAGANLEELLVRQGKKCLVRAFKASEATVTFYPLTRLPALIRGGKLNLPLNQLLFACYRSVDDWFTLESAFASEEDTFVLTRELDEQVQYLQLEAGEAQMVEAVRPGRTIQELTQVTQLKPFEVCRLLFRFVKLGLIAKGPRREPNELSGGDPTAAPLNENEPAHGSASEPPTADRAAAPADDHLASPPVTESSSAPAPDQDSPVDPAPKPEELAVLSPPEAAAIPADGSPAVSPPEEAAPPVVETALNPVMNE
jgi:hypothetical protein